MSESLKLVGFKRILNHATDDGSDKQLSLVPPPKGNAHFVPRWWDKKANQKIYISCTKLAIQGSDLEIVVPSSFSTRLAITFDGDVENLVFGVRMDVSRVALIDKVTGEIALQYVFPSIKNRTAKVTKLVNEDYEGSTEGDGGDIIDPNPTPEPEPTPDEGTGFDSTPDPFPDAVAAPATATAAPKKKKATNKKRAVVTVDTPPDCGTCFG